MSIFWTLAGFFVLVIVPNVNQAFMDIPVRDHFFGIDNTLFFFLISIPYWVVIALTVNFYKKFEWENDLGYLTLKVLLKNLKSNIKDSESKINTTKDRLRKELEDDT